jgi:co-chaperonin GroES (HSP10)
MPLVTLSHARLTFGHHLLLDDAAFDQDLAELVARAAGLPFRLVEFKTDAEVLAAFQRGDMQTEGGLWLPKGHATDREDGIQGCVGLIVKAGPGDSRTDICTFGEKPAMVGDWAVIDSRLGMRLMMNKRNCRIISSDVILAIVASPDIVV